MDKIDLNSYSAESLIVAYSLMTSAYLAGPQNESIDLVQDLRNSIYLKLTILGMSDQADEIDKIVKQNLPSNGGS